MLYVTKCCNKTKAEIQKEVVSFKKRFEIF